MERDTTAKKIRCPRCKKLTTWTDNPYRPFCGERCKLIDLGKWAEGGYQIKGENLEDLSGDEI